MSLPYQYVTLRCVPRVEREEFVNVGVVVFCQQVDVLASAFAVDEGRVRVLDPRIDLSALEAALRRVGAVCDGEDEYAAIRQGERFGWIAAPRSTVLQPGPRHGGLTDDPHAELDRLLALLVLPLAR